MIRSYIEEFLRGAFDVVVERVHDDVDLIDEYIPDIVDEGEDDGGVRELLGGVGVLGRDVHWDFLGRVVVFWDVHVSLKRRVRREGPRVEI